MWPHVASKRYTTNDVFIEQSPHFPNWHKNTASKTNRELFTFTSIPYEIEDGSFSCNIAGGSAVVHAPTKEARHDSATDVTFLT